MRRPRERRASSSLPGDVLRRQAHAVALVGLRQHLHQQRGVGHRARHRPGGAAHVGRVDRDAAEAGLEGEDAAPAGGQPQRAADVGAEVQRPVAGGRRRARAGAGAARGSCSGPRGCASARGSSTGPTTACRSRASWSCRGSPRRPRARGPPAARRAAAGASSVAAVPSGNGVAAGGDVLLDRDGTPSIGPSGAPFAASAPREARACGQRGSGSSR